MGVPCSADDEHDVVVVVHRKRPTFRDGNVLYCYQSHPYYALINTSHKKEKVRIRVIQMANVCGLEKVTKVRWKPMLSLFGSFSSTCSLLRGCLPRRDPTVRISGHQTKTKKRKVLRLFIYTEWRGRNTLLLLLSVLGVSVLCCCCCFVVAERIACVASLSCARSSFTSSRAEMTCVVGGV